MRVSIIFQQADEVESKADDMAEAIAEQNKKVEEESNAMEKAIDEKSKQVDTKEQENKFEKASKQVDAVGDAADSKFEEKGELERFHMTSQQPCWCTKTMEWWPYWFTRLTLWE